MSTFKSSRHEGRTYTFHEGEEETGNHLANLLFTQKGHHTAG